jgi:hypothetical protein
MTEQPKGSGGVYCTPRMSALIAQAWSGVLSTFEGGQELRGLYRKGQLYFTSRTFVLIDPHDLANSHFRGASRLVQRVCAAVLPR